MTPPVSGGVPEQGLREAAQRVLKEFEVPSCDGKDRRFDYAACDWCDGEGEETRPETIAHEPSCVIGQLRAALERPRPALPDWSRPPLDVSGITLPHNAVRAKIPEFIYCAKCGKSCDPVNDSDVPVTLCTDCARAALPAEHAPPAFTDEDFKAMAGAAMLRDTDETGTSPLPRPWQRLKTVYESLIRSRPALAGSPDDAEIFALLKVLAEQDCESWGCEFPASRHACAPTRARRLLGRRVSGTPEEHP